MEKRATTVLAMATYRKDIEDIHSLLIDLETEIEFIAARNKVVDAGESRAMLRMKIKSLESTIKTIQQMNRESLKIENAEFSMKKDCKDFNLDIFVSCQGNLLRDIESEAILKAVKMCGGNKSRASKMLGVTVKTLYNKLERIK